MFEAFRNIRSSIRATPILWQDVVFLVVTGGVAIYLDMALGGSGRGLGAAAFAWVAVAVTLYSLIRPRFAKTPAVWSDSGKGAIEPKPAEPAPTPASFRLEPPDVIVGVVMAIGCVVWFMLRDDYVAKYLPPICLLIGLQCYLGTRDKYVKPRRKGPRKSPLEQLQEWDDDGRF